MVGRGALAHHAGVLAAVAGAVTAALRRPVVRDDVVLARRRHRLGEGGEALGRAELVGVAWLGVAVEGGWARAAPRLGEPASVPRHDGSDRTSATISFIMKNLLIAKAHSATMSSSHFIARLIMEFTMRFEL